MPSNMREQSNEAADSSETVLEIGGLVMNEGASEADNVDPVGAHRPVSYSIPAESAVSLGANEGAGEAGGASEGFGLNLGPFSVSFEAGEEGSNESQFEAVEGFDETSLTEAAGEETEAAVDAWYGGASEAEQQEFFQFLVPFILPALKTVLPIVANAAVKNLSPTIASILQKFGKPRPKVRMGREAGEEAGFDEAALEAAIQQMEMIVDRDDRVPIPNTTAVPWNRICHLQITAANGKRFLGSGALVGPRTVVTAGHCVHMSQQGGWASSITVSPGRNGDSRPFGQAKAVGLRSVQGWVGLGRREYDYGAIILPSSFQLRNPSAFGFASLQDGELRERKLNLAGYPGDKAAGTLWYAGRKAKSVTSRTLVYNTASAGGQSGAPVWLKRSNGQRIMVGIHTNGSPNGNSATRITAAVLANMKRWRQEGMQLTTMSQSRGRQSIPGQFESV